MFPLHESEAGPSDAIENGAAIARAGQTVASFRRLTREPRHAA
jgi:hypothetical protein